MNKELHERLYDTLFEVREHLRGKKDQSELYDRVHGALYEVKSHKPELTLDEYQEAAGRTAIYVGKGTPIGLNYVALKLNGEAGEVAENVGKAMRDDGLITFVGSVDQYGLVTIKFNEMLPHRKEKIKLELGDVLWYLARAAAELGYKLSEIGHGNLTKLSRRAANGLLTGSGSDR